MPTDYSLIVLTEEELATFKKFKKSDTAFLTKEEFRLLERKGLLISVIDGKSTWFDGISDGMCTLSQKGKEFRSYRKEHHKELWLVNAKIPILVSFITTIGLHLLLWLLPVISQWFASFL